jgi:hypothetical protein
MAPAVRLLVAALLLGPVTAHAGADTCAGPRFYGTYSVGERAGDGKVPLARRLRELRDLGGNLVVGTGKKTEILDLLPEGVQGVPGCGLMKEEDWKDKQGRWDEQRARRKLAELAARFARHPKVYGVCLTHEVTEYADHDRRVWMYRLAKAYFPAKPVIQYYGLLTDRENAERKPVDGYGLRGERETDILFVSLPAVAGGRFRGPHDLGRLDSALTAAARTPGIPVWGQTSINADNKMVTGPETMGRVWGAHGENMPIWADALFAASAPDAQGQPIRLSGFFWRSLGRFPWDLGFPAFADHRAQMRAIRAKHCLPG